MGEIYVINIAQTELYVGEGGGFQWFMRLIMFILTQCIFLLYLTVTTNLTVKSAYHNCLSRPGVTTRSMCQNRLSQITVIINYLVNSMFFCIIIMSTLSSQVDLVMLMFPIPSIIYFIILNAALCTIFRGFVRVIYFIILNTTKNELSQSLLTGETGNTQGSKDARLQAIVRLS